MRCTSSTRSPTASSCWATAPRVNTTGLDVRVMRNQKGYVSGCNGQLAVTC